MNRQPNCELRLRRRAPRDKIAEITPLRTGPSVRNGPTCGGCPRLAGGSIAGMPVPVRKPPRPPWRVWSTEWKDNGTFDAQTVQGLSALQTAQEPSQRSGSA